MWSKQPFHCLLACVTEMASHSAGFTLATDIQVTLRDPEGISQVRWNQWKLQVRLYSNLVPLPNTPVCFGTRARPLQKSSLPQISTQASQVFFFFTFVSLSWFYIDYSLDFFPSEKTISVMPGNHDIQISCIWHSKFWYWYRWPPKLNNGSSNNGSPWKLNSLPLAGLSISVSKD